MRFFFKIFIVFALVFGALSCSQKPAQITNRSKNVYNKNNSSLRAKYRTTVATSNIGNNSEAVSQNSVPATSKVTLQNNQIEVGAGDTVFGISKKYQVPLRDLVKENNLVAPYILKVGTKLTIPAATYHEVKSGETLYAISRIYNMQIDQLIEINDLQKPYAVKVGDRIKIAKSTQMPQSLKTEAKAVAKMVVEKSEGVTPQPKFVAQVTDKLNKFSWPLRGSIISKFGPKSGGLYNDGINIKAKEGSEVKAAEDGVVAYVGNELKGYGNLVIIKHAGGWITAYAHLSKTMVTRGQKINQGSKVGTVGSTGNVTSPQLYFGLRKGRDAVNPQNYLK